MIWFPDYVEFVTSGDTAILESPVFSKASEGFNCFEAYIYAGGEDINELQV